MLLSDYLRAARRGWVIILVTVLLALACAAGLTARKTDVYTTSTQLFIAASVPGAKPQELYQRNLIAAQRVSSYVTIAGGDLVADRVTEILGSDIGASVSVTIVPATVVMQITASGSDPDRVAEVANAYAKVLPGVIDEIEAIDDSSAQLRITVVDEADVPSAPVPSSSLMLFVAALLFGLGLAFTIVTVREVLRREKAEAAGGTRAPEGAAA